LDTPLYVQNKNTVQTVVLAPKKLKTVFSAERVMATFSWDSYGVILIDNLRKGKTITGA
jgi:hypothetical protein